MRTTLEPALTQQWTGIGLGKWHQSIAKRESSRIGIQTKRVVIQWTTMESEAESTSTSPATSAPRPCTLLPSLWSEDLNVVDGPQVVLIARSKVDHAIALRSGIDKAMFPVFCQRSSMAPVFLLWDWGRSGRSSLEWATSLGFAGVIFDFSTLRSWTRVAVDRLPCKLKELHPLVAKLPTYKSVQRRI